MEVIFVGFEAADGVGESTGKCKKKTLCLGEISGA
jgi:hypothetical protein